NKVNLTVVAGTPAVANSAISVASNNVVSAQSVLATAQIKDAYGNPLPAATVVFKKSGGTSTGTLSATTNVGNGVYTAVYSGIVAGTAQALQVEVNGTVLSMSANITVIPGPASSATSTLATTATSILSGNSATISAHLRDVNGNSIPSGVFVNFAKSGGTASGTLSPVNNDGGGVYSTTYTGINAGLAQTISVVVDGITLSPTVSVAVTANAPSLANSTLTITNGTVTSGQFVTLVATLKDLNNNPVESGFTVTPTMTGGTSTGTFTAVTNQGNGAYSFRFNGVTAGTTKTIGINVNGTALGLTQNISVVPGAPSPTLSTISVSQATISAGATSTISATLRDDNSNVIASGYTVTFTKSGGTSSGTLGSVVNAGSGVYTTTYSGENAGSAQTISVSINGSPLGPTTTIAVLPGAPNNSLTTFTVSTDQVIAGSNSTLTINLKDAYSNPISSGVVVGIQTLGGTSNGTLSAVTNAGGGVYTATFNGTVVGTPLIFQATANAGAIGPTRTVQVLVGAPVAANSSLTVTSSPTASGGTAIIAATIRDAYNNLINNEYSIVFDTILGSSSGTLTNLTHLGNGQHRVDYNAILAGSAQTVRVLADGAPIAGLTASIQVTAGTVSAANSTFSISSTTVQSGTTANLNMNFRDANDNPINNGTVTFVKSTGVSNGNISSPATFSANGNYAATYSATTQGAAQTITPVVNGTTVNALALSVTVIAGPPDHLTLSGTTTGINAIDCNGPYNLTLKDSANNTTSSLSELTMQFQSQTANTFNYLIFDDSNCTNNVTEVTFPIGTSSKSFFFKTFKPLTSNLIVNAPGSIVDLIVGFSVNPVFSWIGSAANSTMTGSGSAVVGSDGAAGSLEPFDIHIDGNNMFVSDFTANRILKYNISTNTYEGWIGHIDDKEGLSGDCASAAIEDITPGWCMGGRSQNSTTPAILTAPRGLGSDGTYLYVASGHRILRFLISTGAFQGWIGRIATVTGMTPVACASAGIGAPTPTWCYGGTVGTSNGDGSFNTPSDVLALNGKLYITDTSNHRLQKWSASGAYEGWMGRINSATGLAPAACVAAGAGAATPTWCTGGTPQASGRRGLNNATPTPDPTPVEGFNNPRPITTDTNYLYIGDSSNYRISRIDLNTNTFAGWIGRLNQATGSAGVYPTSPAYTTNNGNIYPATWISGGGSYESSSATGFGAPYGLDYIDGKLYIADSSYNRVIKIDAADGQNPEWIGRVNSSPAGGASGCSSTPTLSVTPGWCRGGSANMRGPANGAFNSSTGVAVSAGSMYVVDRGNFRIQKFNRSTGAFESWIGAQQSLASTWSRNLSLGASRLGFDNYSFANTANIWNGITLDDSNLFVTDAGWHRIKRHATLNGALIGYIGQLNGSVSSGAYLGYPPTAPEACQGITTGMTPDWCTGGGRTIAGSGVHGYNSPRGIASDGTHIYISNLNNHRLDKVRIADAVYIGWMGQVSTTPTDGDAGCTSTNSPNVTPGWCISGTAGSSAAFGGLDGPRGIFFDKTDTKLFVADNRKIARIDPASGLVEAVIGHITTAGAGCTSNGVVASGWCGVGAVAGTGTNRYGGVSNPTGIATNDTYIFATDLGNHRLLRFNKTTGSAAGFIAQLNSNAGLITNAADLCNGLAGPFPKSTPGWCTGTLVADLSTISGTGNNMFNNPSGVWADETYVYVADSGNNRIVRINAVTGTFEGWKGVIGTTAGMTDTDCINAGVGNVTPKWCDNGTAMPSQKLGGFSYPTGIFGDANYLYVQDSINNRVVTVPRN
ncbi:MAG: hypothetical protein HUU57_05570, partial [Bdellovibrio sp.]|nr:hypothetical protein [Bdellovibrio sp.]